MTPSLPVLASTGPFYLYSLEETFEVLAEAGFDGVELMVTQDRLSQDPHRLAALAARYQLSVPAIHGPFLLATWLVWGFFISTTLLWHSTFTINSLAHVWGSRRYDTTDTSRTPPSDHSCSSTSRPSRRRSAAT